MARKRVEEWTTVVIRIRPELRAKLEVAAIASGVGVADEALRRLERAFVIEEALASAERCEAAAESLDRRRREIEAKLVELSFVPVVIDSWPSGKGMQTNYDVFEY